MGIEGKRVCVTGAGGYIGSHVVRVLLDGGCRVVGTVRDASDASRTGHLAGLEGLELVSADLMTPGALDETLESCDLVVHTASSVRLTAKDPQREIVDVAVGLTRNVLQSCRASGRVERVVVTSSIAAVGDETRPEGHTYTEDDWNEHATIGQDPYFVSKIEAEREAHRFAASLPEAERFTLVAVHPAFVLGPVLARVHLRSSPATIRAMLRGKMPAVPRLNLAVVDVRDVAEVHARALQIESPASRYICAAGNMWLVDMGRTLKRRFPDHGVPTRQLPDLLAYATAAFTRQLTVDFLRRNLGRTRVFSARRAQQDMGLSFRPLETTLADTARSIVQGGWL